MLFRFIYSGKLCWMPEDLLTCSFSLINFILNSNSTINHEESSRVLPEQERIQYHKKHKKKVKPEPKTQISLHSKTAW